LIFSFITVCHIGHSQENNFIEPFIMPPDTLLPDSVIDANYFNFINEEVIRNLIKDTAKLPATYEEFKIKFLALKLNNEPVDIGLPKVKQGIPPLLDQKYIKSLGFALNSPISFFYYNFSKVERSRRKAYELRNEREQYAIIDSKINRLKMQHWTGLKDQELDKFILYCDFSFNYMLTTKEYDLILKVKEKLEDYKRIEHFTTN
jgi:hypothetical protein